MKRPGQSIRQKILVSVGTVVVVSLLGSVVSIFRIAEVNRSLKNINDVSVPLGRLLVQLESDSEILNRQLRVGLGYSNWGNPHWTPKAIPKWMSEVIHRELVQVSGLFEKSPAELSPEMRQKFIQWSSEMIIQYRDLEQISNRLYQVLKERNETKAAEIYPSWINAMERWTNKLQWGSRESERSFQNALDQTQTKISGLRSGLELVLLVVVFLSLLLLWFGERALRPLVELTTLARNIKTKGLRPETKQHLPEVPISSSDEVSQLKREFYQMATALLEREKTVESQKERLEQQNLLLRQVGALNENILNSIEAVLLVTDSNGMITQCNPVASRWLNRDTNDLIGTSVKDWYPLAQFLPEFPVETVKTINVAEFQLSYYSGKWMPLRSEKSVLGAILILEDVTHEVSIRERLRVAENLAAVGRMSAQVAHEIRNPLHSIGLEADLALEGLSKIEGQSRASRPIKFSLQSILTSVDRLDKITENYLRFSKLSSGRKSLVDLNELLESILVTYSQVCESKQIKVNWSVEKEGSYQIMGDRDLIEQALGNLFNNSVQALEKAKMPRQIQIDLGHDKNGGVYMRVSDNGGGVPVSIRTKLFTPFFTTKAQGTGLGLAFVKKVLEDHGGQIRYDEKEKKGAAFLMSFPLVQNADLEVPLG